MDSASQQLDSSAVHWGNRRLAHETELGLHFLFAPRMSFPGPQLLPPYSQKGSGERPWELEEMKHTREVSCRLLVGAHFP